MVCKPSRGFGNCAFQQILPSRNASHLCEGSTLQGRGGCEIAAGLCDIFSKSPRNMESIIFNKLSIFYIRVIFFSLRMCLEYEFSVTK